MTVSKNTLALALALGLTAPLAFAQDAPAPAAPEAPAAEAPAATAPATEAPAATSAEGPGTIYTAKTSGDWEVHCLRTEDGKDPCEMFQLLKDSDGNKVASISVMMITGEDGTVAGATIATPLDTLLAPGLRLQIDASEPVGMPFNHCDNGNGNGNGTGNCYVNFAISTAELDRLKKGNAIKMAVVPLFAPEKPVELTISLKGFTAAYEEIAKSVAQ